MASEDKKKKKIKVFKEFDPSKYIDTEPRIDEAVMKDTVVFSFGRMNPITIGHEKLAMKLMAEASKRKADPAIFLSHSSDAKKNPLSYDDKIKFAKKAFGSVVKQSPAKTIIEVAKSLSGKYKKIVLVVGQDRIEEFKSLLNRYNNKEYNFESIEIVSAGARDPDSEGVEGMSASKMRELAQTGDIKAFTSGLPKKLKSNAKEVYDAVRKGMGMNEEVETDLDEALTRAQRIKRSRAMKRARFKIRRGKEKSERKTASMAVLKKRARKAAIAILKKKFTKSRDYNDMSAGEKEMIDKRIERISKKRIDQIARKLIPMVRKKDRERLASKRASKTEDLNTRFENFLNEASCSDTQVRKRPHMLLGDDMKPKIDRRFRMFKKKVNEEYEDLAEELAAFTLDMDRFLEEGINDPAIFKAVFLAGGPGSGKSFIVGKTALTSLGMRVINSDEAFEAALKKAGLKATPEDIYSEKGQEIRGQAKALTKKKMNLALDGRLGLVIDGTGKDYAKIEKQANKLRNIGYEVAMIFVNTDLDTALERNRARSRSLPDSEVEAMWKDVQKNLGKFQNLFRQKMFIVDNSAGSNYEASVLSTYKKIMNWSKQKPESSAAKQWIMKQRMNESLFLEKSKGLWANIHAKRKRGEPPAKPGDKDYPKTLDIGEEVINETGGAGDWGTPKLTRRFKKDTPIILESNSQIILESKKFSGIVYHGSGSKFDKFDQNKARITNDFYGGGVAYFTDNLGVAKTYAKSMARKTNDEPRIYTVKLTMSKVFDVDDIFSGKDLVNILPKDVEDFARGAGLLGLNSDKYMVLSNLKSGNMKLSGDQVFKGLSKGMNATAKARDHLISKGYDGLRYNGGVNMGMATKHSVYLSYDAKDIEIQKKQVIRKKQE